MYKILREAWKLWKRFHPIWNGLFILSLCFVAIVLVIIVKFPAWLKNDWLFFLAPSVFLAVGDIMANLIQIFQGAYNSIRELERVKNTLFEVTSNSLLSLAPRPKGIPELIRRDETNLILEQLDTKNKVLLTGEAGVGKSGIATALTTDANEVGYFVLLVDARRLSEVHTPVELSQHFDQRESINNCVEKIADDTKFILIIDQLDNIAGTTACNIVIDFLINCSRLKNVAVIVGSRHREANEQGAIRPLLEAGFEMVACQSLDRQSAARLIQRVGISDVSDSLLELANNLLNLDIICEIVRESTPDEVTSLEDEISLWEKYRLTLRERENGNNHGDEIIAEAVRLARLGLESFDRGFDIDFPPNLLQSRLKSGDVIRQVAGRRHQFSREKLQDYLYAWDACERNKVLENVHNEIGNLHARNVILLMRDIYESRDNTELVEQFLDGVLDG